MAVTKRKVEISSLNDEEWRAFLTESEKMPLINRRIMRLSSLSRSFSIFSTHVVPDALTDTACEPMSCRATLFRVPSKFTCSLALMRPSWERLVHRIQGFTRSSSLCLNAFPVPSAFADDTKLDLFTNPLCLSLVGTPGCGNSLFLFYLVALVLNKDPRVPGLIFDSGPKTYVFDAWSLKCGKFKESISSFVTVWSRERPSSVARVDDLSTWRTYWTVQDGGLSLSYSGLHLRLTSTLIREDVGMKRGLFLFHERWSKEEVAAILRLCVSERSWIPLVARKIRTYGPIPRDIFSLEPRKIIPPTTDLSQLKRTTFQQYIRSAHWFLWWWPPIDHQTGDWMDPVGVSFTSLDMMHRMTPSVHKYVRQHHERLVNDRLGHLLVSYVSQLKTFHDVTNEASIEIVDSEEEAGDPAPIVLVTDPDPVLPQVPGTLSPSLLWTTSSIAHAPPWPTGTSNEAAPSKDQPIVSAEPPLTQGDVSPIVNHTEKATNEALDKDHPHSLSSSTTTASLCPSAEAVSQQDREEDDSSADLLSLHSDSGGLVRNVDRSFGETLPPPPPPVSQRRTKRVVSISPPVTFGGDVPPESPIEEADVTDKSPLIAQSAETTSDRPRKRGGGVTEKHGFKSGKTRRTNVHDALLDPLEAACLLNPTQQQQVNQVAMSTPGTPNQEELRAIILRNAENYKELRYQLRMVKSSLVQLLQEWGQTIP